MNSFSSHCRLVVIIIIITANIMEICAYTLQAWKLDLLFQFSSWHGHTHYICSFSSQHLLVVIIILIIITTNITEICIFASMPIHITHYMFSSHHLLVLINIISIIITAKHHCHCYFCRQAHTHEVFSSSFYHHHIYELDYCQPHSSSPSSAKT